MVQLFLSLKSTQLSSVFTVSRWSMSDTRMVQAARKEAEKASPYFVLLKEMGDLLMLPKDMLMDKSLRKEVCIIINIII